MKGIIRPEPVVLPDTSAIPARNRILPAPNQFTHEVTRRQPFYFSSAQQGTAPNGEFPAGAKVTLLLHEGGSSCRVVNEEGLYVEIEHDALRKL
jgi:hypothetical protein